MPDENVLAFRHARKTYGIHFTRRVPGCTVPEVLVRVEPDAQTLSEAIERGKKAFASRGADASADGFCIIERSSGEPYF